MTNLVSLRTLLGLSLVLSMAACSSRSRSVEVPGPKPTNNGDDARKGDAGDYKDADATITFKQQDTADYLNTDGDIEYKFKFLDVEQDGKVQFASGTGIINLTQLPSGLEGTIELSLFENGEEKLKGTKTATLSPGANKFSITLTPVGGNDDDPNDNNDGDKDANLELEVVIDGVGTSTNTGTGTGTNTGGSGVVNFASIQAISAKSCYGSCHYHRTAETEDFWKETDKKKLEARLTGIGGSIMPPADSVEAKGFSDADREKLKEYVKSL